LTTCFAEKEKLLKTFYTQSADIAAEQYGYTHSVESSSRENKFKCILDSILTACLIVVVLLLHWYYSWIMLISTIYTVLFVVVSLKGGYERLDLTAAGY
jgi:hypothetical protein